MKTIGRFHATVGVKVDGTVVPKFAFNQVDNRKWVKLDIKTRYVLAQYEETDRDEWSVYLNDVNGRIYIDFWTKKIRGEPAPAGADELFIVPKKK